MPYRASKILYVYFGMQWNRGIGSDIGGFAKIKAIMSCFINEEE